MAYIYMSLDVLKREFVPKFLIIGKEKFYKFLLVFATNKLMLINKGTYNGIYPDLEYLEYYDNLIILYRREGTTELLEMGKLFRRASHRIHRIMIKKDMTKENDRFLHAV